jgi:hypothetical protein
VSVGRKNQQEFLSATVRTLWRNESAHIREQSLASDKYVVISKPTEPMKPSHLVSPVRRHIRERADYCKLAGYIDLFVGS